MLCLINCSEYKVLIMVQGVTKSGTSCDGVIKSCARCDRSPLHMGPSRSGRVCPGLYGSVLSPGPILITDRISLNQI